MMENINEVHLTFISVGEYISFSILTAVF